MENSGQESTNDNNNQAAATTVCNTTLQELLRVLRSPSSPLQQQKVLNILRSNPPLVAAFIRQRAARYQGGQGGPGGVGGPPQGASVGVRFQVAAGGVSGVSGPGADQLPNMDGQQQVVNQTGQPGMNIAQGGSAGRKNSCTRLHVAEVVHGKLAVSKTVVIHFSEAEATVEGIATKVREALGSEEGFILTDSQGHKILDSVGTRSSQYWKQNSGKVFALPESEFRDFQNGQRAKRSRRAEASDLQDVVQHIDGLKRTSDSISQPSEMAEKKVTEANVKPVKEAFTCLVCLDVMVEPTFSKCCCSLLGCGACVREWLQTSDHCLKCRSPNFKRNIHSVKGLDAALAFMK